MSTNQSFSLYEEVSNVGGAALRARVQWWERHRLAVQTLVLLIDLLLLLAVLFAGWAHWWPVVSPAVLLLCLGLAVLAGVGYMPRFYEMVRSDYHARIRVGCRKLGGIAAMPAAMLQVSGPLRSEASRFVTDACLDEREQECLTVLAEDWSGSLGELVAAARSLSRSEMTGGSGTSSG